MLPTLFWIFFLGQLRAGIPWTGSKSVPNTPTCFHPRRPTKRTPVTLRARCSAESLRWPGLAQEEARAGTKGLTRRAIWLGWFAIIAQIRVRGTQFGGSPRRVERLLHEPSGDCLFVLNDQIISLHLVLFMSTSLQKATRMPWSLLPR